MTNLTPKHLQVKTSLNHKSVKKQKKQNKTVTVVINGNVSKPFWPRLLFLCFLQEIKRTKVLKLQHSNEERTSAQDVIEAHIEPPSIVTSSRFHAGFTFHRKRLQGNNSLTRK